MKKSVQESLQRFFKNCRNYFYFQGENGGRINEKNMCFMTKLLEVIALECSGLPINTLREIDSEQS